MTPPAYQTFRVLTPRMRNSGVTVVPVRYEAKEKNVKTCATLLNR